MRVNREELLRDLEMVVPGLSPREIVEQSSCFIFQRGKVVTFNDEIACIKRCVLAKSKKNPDGVQGAVQSASLVDLLKKLPEEELDISASDGELLIVGKKRKAGVRMEAEIVLPMEALDIPDSDSWVALPEGFCESIGIVQNSAGNDERAFASTCVHLHPKWLEATDNFQLTRFYIETPISKSRLVRRNSIKHIAGLAMTEFAETESWLHFRNSQGLVMACRHFEHDYPDLGGLLKMDGEPLTLPKGLTDAVERSEVFSKANSDDNQVKVILKSGKLRIRGEGAAGWYEERKTINYTGRTLEFLIAPKLLYDLVQNHNQCKVNPDVLLVDGGKFVYATSLENPEDKKGEQDASSEPKEGGED